MLKRLPLPLVISQAALQPAAIPFSLAHMPGQLLARPGIAPNQ